MADYNKQTVVELRAEMKARGIAQTGLTRKQQLIERLEADDTEKIAGTVEKAETEVVVTQELGDEQLQKEPEAEETSPLPEPVSSSDGHPHGEPQAPPLVEQTTQEQAVEQMVHQQTTEEEKVQMMQLDGVSQDVTNRESAPQDDGKVPDENVQGVRGDDSKVLDENVQDVQTDELRGETTDPEMKLEEVHHEPTQQVHVAVTNDSTDEVTHPTQRTESPEKTMGTKVELTASVTQPDHPAAATTDQKAISPLTSSIGKEHGKRKRRSQSPQMSTEEVVKKKLKQGGDENVEYAPAVHLKEDDTASAISTHVDVEMQDATVAPTVSSAPMEKVPTSSNSDVRETSGKQNQASQPSPERYSVQTSVPPSNKDVRDNRYRDLFPRRDTLQSKTADSIMEDVGEEQDRDVEAAIHPATPALYIKNFMRPLQISSLKDHLTLLAQRSGEANEKDASQVMTLLHLDGIKTHCFAVFSSVSAAARVRSALHARVWPAERTRKPLWVDFVPEDKVRDWIDEEVRAASGPGGRFSKRWEVIYDRLEDGTVTAHLRDAASSASSGGQAINASSRAQVNVPLPEVQRESLERRPAASAQNRKTEAPASASFLALDSLFKFTSAKPKLYYQPVNSRLADRRLDAFDDAISQRYRDDVADGLASQYHHPADMRRYTFEEDDLLVDNGPEFGLRQQQRQGGAGASAGGSRRSRGRGGGGGAGGYRMGSVSGGGGGGWRGR